MGGGHDVLFWQFATCGGSKPDAVPVHAARIGRRVIGIGVKLFAIYRGLCVTEDAFSAGVKRATSELKKQRREDDIEAGWLVRKDAE